MSAGDVPGSVMNLLLNGGANASIQGHLQYHGHCHSTDSLTSQAGPVLRENGTSQKVECSKTQGSEMWKSCLLVSSALVTAKKQLCGAWLGVLSN